MTMNEVPVFYATSEGHTRRIAERIASVLRERGLESAALDVASREVSAIDWRGVSGALLGASLHAGNYQRRAGRFVREHCGELNRRSSAFFGVSLSAASRNPGERDEARRLARAFTEKAGWSPKRVESFGGALAYSRYGFLVRYFMKRIARKEGGPTDTRRDHDLTNWIEVDRFAHEMADLLLREERRAVPASA
jgi:menaquinone-dependent protoporphyrinogen oxidase